MCPSMVGVAFSGQYCETFATVNPGNDLKLLEYGLGNNPSQDITLTDGEKS